MPKRYECSAKCINKKDVLMVEKGMLSDETLERVSNLFKAIEDKTRIKILYALALKELCVCDLASIIKISHSGVSHQLSVLRNQEMVNHRKVGGLVYYSIKDEDVLHMIKSGIKHAKHSH